MSIPLSKGLLLTPNSVVLLNFNRLPVTTLAPEASTIGLLPTEFQGIFKQSFELEFEADYFSAIELLERLEKVEGDLYWEGLDYKVTKYPQATVTLKLYLLSRDKEQL